MSSNCSSRLVDFLHRGAGAGGDALLAARLDDVGLRRSLFVIEEIEIADEAEHLGVDVGT